MKKKHRLEHTQKKWIVIPILGFLAVVPLVSGWAEEKNEREVQGLVESIPVRRQGVWKIGGRHLMATAATQLKEKHCQLKVGALAEAEYKHEGKTLLAKEIKCQTEIEIKGAVQMLPAKRLGTWKIAGQTLKADQHTQFDDKDCPIQMGSLVEAKLQMTPQGLVLKKIECETDDED